MITGYVLFLSCFFVGEAKAVQKLKFVLWATPKSAHELSLREFAKLVGKKTNGKTIIEVINGIEGRIPIKEGLTIVRSGRYDGAVIPALLIARFFPKLATLSFPFLFADEEHVDKTVYGKIGQNLLMELSETTRVKGLAFLEDGFLDIGSAKQPIKEPADFEEISINIIQPIGGFSFKALLAHPVRVAATEVIQALQKGIVNSTELMIYSGSLRDFVKISAAIIPYLSYLSLTKHSYETNVMVINLDRFNNLRETGKRALLESAEEISKLNAAEVRKGREEILERLRSKGVIIVHPNRVAIRKTLNNVFENPPKGISKNLLIQIKNACRLPPFCGSVFQ